MGIPSRIGGSATTGTVEATDIQLANGKVLVGNASGISAAVNISTDATISNAGVLTLADGLIHTVETVLTGAQVIALNAAPITVCADPGANKTVIFLGGIVMISGGTTNYDRNENMTIQYTGSTVVSTTVANFFNGGASGKLTTIKQLTTDITPIANSALTIACSASPKNAQGDRGAKVRIRYAILATN
jgi:hypothetical protein